MRAFNEREKAIIQQLIECAGSGLLTMQNFLQKVYFTESLQRALIIQSRGEYAVFFLKTELFSNEEIKSNEIENFFELFALINFLVKEGYITLFRDKTEKMYYMQDGFNAVKIRNNTTIVLNTLGYYTSAPDTIHDNNKNVIYQGIEFRGDQYQFILNYSIGNLIISQKIKDILHVEDSSTQSAQKPNSVKKSVIPFINMALLIIIIGLIALIFLIAAAKKEQLLGQINAIKRNTDHIKDSLRSALSAFKEINSKDTLGSNKLSDEDRILFGLDISKWNGKEITEIPIKDSISFIICKATEGQNYIDSEFSKNWDLIRKHNYILGTYHFYHTDQDPLKQAEHFLTTVNSKGSPDIAPIVDIEQASLSGISKKTDLQIQKDLIAFLKHVESKSKRVPIIYTGLAFADEFLINTELSHYPLWLAEYTSVTSPKVPVTWKESGFKIWQKRDNYFIDSQLSDLDVFFGARIDLIK